MILKGNGYIKKITPILLLRMKFSLLKFGKVLVESLF